MLHRRLRTGVRPCLQAFRSWRRLTRNLDPSCLRPGPQTCGSGTVPVFVRRTVLQGLPRVPPLLPSRPPVLGWGSSTDHAHETPRFSAWAGNHLAVLVIPRPVTCCRFCNDDVAIVGARMQAGGGSVAEPDVRWGQAPDVHCASLASSSSSWTRSVAANCPTQTSTGIRAATRWGISLMRCPYGCRP